jgi:Glyoxalase-like domain
VFLAAAHGHILSFQRVPEATSGKNRVHVDVRVEDLGAATDEILAIGGAWDGNERTLDASCGRSSIPRATSSTSS